MYGFHVFFAGGDWFPAWLAACVPVSEDLDAATSSADPVVGDVYSTTYYVFLPDHAHREKTRSLDIMYFGIRYAIYASLKQSLIYGWSTSANPTSPRSVPICFLVRFFRHVYVKGELPLLWQSEFHEASS